MQNRLLHNNTRHIYKLQSRFLHSGYTYMYLFNLCKELQYPLLNANEKNKKKNQKI